MPIERPVIASARDKMHSAAASELDFQALGEAAFTTG
jgi:hypothetical protein